MSRFSIKGEYCFGSGEIDDNVLCQSKPHEADCLCNDCSCKKSYLVRCSECGSVFDPFYSWHESASGAAKCLEGKGKGNYPFKKKAWDQFI